MKAKKKRYPCPHCGQTLPPVEKIINHWAMRSRPPDGKKGGALPAKASAHANDEPEKQHDPIATPGSKQPPALSLPITLEEIRSLALSLYGQALNDPKARKYILQLHALTHDVAIECAYYTGAWHALMTLRSRQPGIGNN